MTSGSGIWTRHYAGCTRFLAIERAGLRASLKYLEATIRRPADGQAFLEAFPELELADGTALPGYNSPHR
jgi:hypothetical protein